MRAAEYDLYIEQGVSWSQVFRFKSDDTTYIDLTGYTFRGKIRTKASATSALVDFTFTLLDQTNPATIGSVKLSLTSTQTSALPVEDSISAKRKITVFCYDVECVRPDTSVLRLLSGEVEVSPEVTR